MQFDLNDLPSDAALLHSLVRDMASAVEQRDGEIERLQLIIKQLQRARFGRRSERIDADQLALGLEDLETDEARAEAKPEPAKTKNRKKKQSGRKPLPDNLPRKEVRIDVSATACACCGGALHPIGESVSEMLDWVPAQFRVIRICRPKYGCRACGTVSQAPAPERPIAGGMATPALLAQVLVSKYCDHTPLYRQSQIYARLGIDLDRSTLAGWVGGACWWLEALYERLCTNVFASDHLFADDTPVPVLDPGRGRTKTGRLWVYARDQRPWSGPALPSSSSRPTARASGRRRTWRTSRAFSTSTAMPASLDCRRGDVTLAACWVHMRRNFYEFFESTQSPIAGEALRRIAELYAIEERIRGQSPAMRLAERRTFSKPLVEKLKAWLEQQLTRVPPRGKLADAIRYALTRWNGLTRFLHDGRVELDTNPVERAIRPVALGRKNHLFAGSDVGGERWATLCSIIETCKMNDVEPYEYLHDVLQRMVDGHPVNRLDELLPWNWKPPEAVNSTCRLSEDKLPPIAIERDG
jgi:transposase